MKKQTIPRTFLLTAQRMEAASKAQLDAARAFEIAVKKAVAHG